MKHWQLSLVGGLALTLLLGACGGGSNKATSTVAPTATTAAAAGEASATHANTPTVPATATTATTPTKAAATATIAAPTPTKPRAATATSAATAAATGTSATGGATPTSESTPAYDPAVMAKLTSAALTLEDFPEGWTQQPSAPSDTSSTDLCNKPAFDRRGERLGDVEIDSQASNDGPFVYQALTEFPSDTAFAAWNAAKDAASCTDWTEIDSSGVETTYHLRQLEDPVLGDESFAVELTFDVPELGTATSDAIYIRVGNAFTLVAWSALGPVDSQNLLDLATRAADKLQAAYAP